MQSDAKDVATYLQELPRERQECLRTLRNLCRSTLTGYDEGMDYGMPCYKKNGSVQVAFASQKNYISLYILKAAVVNANRQLLKGLNVGKSCIKYTKPDRVDFSIVKKLLSDTLTSQEDTC
jgi:uncharacterized protein YdhG (YjbR/CyaY superfamily)